MPSLSTHVMPSQQPALGKAVHLPPSPPPLSSPSLHRRAPRPQRPCPIPPPHQLTESVVERDICSLVLSVSVRMNQPFLDETGVKRVVIAEEPHPQPRPSTLKPVAYGPFIEQLGQQGADRTVAGSAGVLSAKVAEAEADRVCLDNVVASAVMHKSVLPEMRRVQEWFERCGELREIQR